MQLPRNWAESGSSAMMTARVCVSQRSLKCDFLCLLLNWPGETNGPVKYLWAWSVPHICVKQAAADSDAELLLSLSNKSQ